MNRLILCLFLIFSTDAFAAIESVTGTIKAVKLMGKNYDPYSTAGEAIVFIDMDELPVACGNSSSYRRVAMGSDHPAFDVVVSAALAAKAAALPVTMVFVEECTVWSSPNAWDLAMIQVQ